IAVFTIGITTRLSFNNNLQAMVNNLTEPTHVVEIIQEQFAVTGDLNQAAIAIDVLSLFYADASQSGMHYTLLDENSAVVRMSQLAIDDASAVSVLNELPIRVDDQVVGTLVVRYVSPPSLLTFLGLDGPVSPRGFLPLFLFVVVVTGLASGILVARMLTAPLEDLADAVRKLNKTPETRVEPSGSDEMREVASAFNEMADAVESSKRLRRQLVGDVAHELRTPLNQIQGTLYAFLDGIYPVTNEELTRLLEQTQNLTRIVNDLREAALAEAGQLPMARTSVDLSKLLEESVGEFRQLAADKAVQLQLEPSEAVTLFVDRERMLQVLRNLLSNAIRHTPSSGKITVGSEVGATNVSLSVCDTGEGISEANLPYVF
ncbi:MAG: histidine kinase dimerization/phospho-acceptor domain-containing protein, partial [Chloroflexota bacterium]